MQCEDETSPADRSADEFVERVLESAAGPMMVLITGIFAVVLLHGMGVWWPLEVVMWLASAGYAASLRQTRRAVRALWRMGFLGWMRPRWWFELAAINLILAVLALGTVLFLGILPANVPAAIKPVANAGFAVVGPLFFTFVVTATVAYGMCLVLWRKPRGRSHFCIIGFYVATLAIFVSDKVILQKQLPEFVPLAILGVGVFVLLVACTIGIVQWWNTREHSRQSTIEG